jgi:hypothetical protein
MVRASSLDKLGMRRLSRRFFIMPRRLYLILSLLIPSLSRDEGRTAFVQRRSAPLFA